MVSAEKLGTEIRQGQIARAALELIAHQGLKKMSIAGVARRVGLVPSALYRHFENKEEMLDSVLDLIREMLLRNVELVSQETADPLERLKRLLFRHIQLIRENRGIPRIVFSEDVYAGHPERKTKVFESIKAYLHQVEKIVHQGQVEAQIRRDLDPGTISIMFLGLIQPAAILWHLSDGHFDVTKHAEKAYRIFCGAITP
jgi:AcrR family transcriptional regulator